MNHLQIFNQFNNGVGFMRHKILKALSVLVVFFFAWTSGGLFNVAYAAYHEIQKITVI